MPENNAIERAYELARRGSVSSVTALKRQLQAEGYDARKLIVGQTLIRSLGQTLRAAKGLPIRIKAEAPRLLTAEERSMAARRASAKRLGKTLA